MRTCVAPRSGRVHTSGSSNQRLHGTLNRHVHRRLPSAFKYTNTAPLMGENAHSPNRCIGGVLQEDRLRILRSDTAHFQSRETELHYCSERKITRNKNMHRETRSIVAPSRSIKLAPCTASAAAYSWSPLYTQQQSTPTTAETIDSL